MIGSSARLIIAHTHSDDGNKKHYFFQDLNNQREFDFDSLIGNQNYAVIIGLPVKIDRIIRDITQTTVLGVSGTMVIRGVVVRGVWDMFGNILEFKKTMSLLSPFKIDCLSLFSDTTEEMFRLVHVQESAKK